MKIIGTDGKEMEVSKISAAARPEMKEAPAPETPPADAASIAPPLPALHGTISANGVMTLTIDLAVVSERPELMDQFSGFMDRFKAVGLNKMVNQQQRRAEIKAALQKQAARNGFRGLMDKIRGGR